MQQRSKTTDLIIATVRRLRSSSKATADLYQKLALEDMGQKDMIDNTLALKRKLVDVNKLEDEVDRLLKELDACS